MASLKQNGSDGKSESFVTQARLACKPRGSLWDINTSLSSGRFTSPSKSESSEIDFNDPKSVRGSLCAPTLCHAHIHLDKCYLLHSPAYTDLRITKGSFEEAMSLTNSAKARFTEKDLLSRGRRLIQESLGANVTSMRAFVEVDEVVQLKCVRAALALKAEFREQCHVQICAFAQLPLFTSQHAAERRRLLEEAIRLDGVDVVGSTPYVEDGLAKMEDCVKYTIDLALKLGKHLDFHLDYNVDEKQEPLVWYVVEQLKAARWTELALASKTICLGHCTRLTLFDDREWQRLERDIANLPIFFIGLPTSDFFMQGRQAGGQRPRATLQIPEMIQKHGLRAAIAVNNVGNAFTPQGSCDPLTIASLGVGIYQAGTEQDAELLYECVSTRAAEAIGLNATGFNLDQGPASLIKFQDLENLEDKSVLQLSHVVYMPSVAQRVLYTVHNFWNAHDR